MARYHFVTVLRLSADRERVWEELQHPERWPAWWRWLRDCEVLNQGGEHSLGARYRYAFGTALPYTLSFETEIISVERPRQLKGRASGELEGFGLWQLEPVAEGGTDVTYSWLVETTKPWMNVLAPVGRPAFSWNHDVLMKDFAKGLARATGATLRSVDNRTVRPGSRGFFQLPGASV